jgi:hypothetical protein
MQRVVLRALLVAALFMVVTSPALGSSIGRYLGAATFGDPQLIAGTDGVDAQTVQTDSGGFLSVFLNRALPAGGNVIGVVNSQQGALTVLNLSGAASVVDAAPGRAVRVNVLVAGTAPGSLNDAATVPAAASPNLFFIVPNTLGSYVIDWPCAAGIVVTPGTGQTLAVSYI